MDLFKIIQKLREEKKRIDRAIFALEELTTGIPAGASEGETPPAAAPAKKRRGRPPKHPRPAATS